MKILANILLKLTILGTVLSPICLLAADSLPKVPNPNLEKNVSPKKAHWEEENENKFTSGPGKVRKLASGDENFEEDETEEDMPSNADSIRNPSSGAHMPKSKAPEANPPEKSHTEIEFWKFKRQDFRDNR